MDKKKRESGSSMPRAFRLASAIVVCGALVGLLQPAIGSNRDHSTRMTRVSGKQQVFPAAVHPGDLDSTFGTGGKVTTDFAGKSDQGFALALQSDGKVVVAGTATVNDAQQSDFALARYNTDGSLDTSFGTGGKVTTDFGGIDQAVSVAIQSDGKIVAAGTSCSNSALGCSVLTASGYDFALARYNTNGTLDTAFGTGGKVTTDFNGGMDIAVAVVIQPDGRIVAGGTACANSSPMCALSGGVQFALARYMSNGSLDASFGTGGKVNTTVLTFGSALTLALQPDGKILAGGTAFRPEGDADFMLVRYQTNGSLDMTFGTGGMVNVDFNSTAQARDADAITSLAIQPDGKIIAVGASETGPPAFFYDFSIARFNTNGSLDSSFGTGGKVTTDLSGGDDQAGSVMIQPDGKILVGGMAAGQVIVGTTSPTLIVGDSGTAPGSDFALVRYNANGTIDTTFGTDGKVRTDFFGASDTAKFLLQPDGRVVAAGFARHNFGAASSKERPPRGVAAAVYGWAMGLADALADSDFALARYETGAAPPQPDFSISFDQPTINQSDPGKIKQQLRINRTNGFSGAVTITPPSSLPTGFSIPTGEQTTTDASVLYVIKIKGSAQFGTHPLTFTATDQSSRSRTTTLTIVFGAQPIGDFSISFDQPTVTGPAPGKIKFNVRINRSGGFTGSVTVSPPPSLPTGVSVPTGEQNTTDASIAYVIKLKASAQPGSYPLVFTGVDQFGRTRTATLTVVVTAP